MHHQQKKHKVERAEDIQQHGNIVLCHRFYRAQIGGHPDLEATPQNHARDIVVRRDVYRRCRVAFHPLGRMLGERQRIAIAEQL